jgi:hypothetical protein
MAVDEAAEDVGEIGLARISHRGSAQPAVCRSGEVGGTA